MVCTICACGTAEAYQLQSNGLPEPYGHTAQVSPHLPNADREWYTEYRWSKGQEYQPQDGVITTQPVHAPIPEAKVKEIKGERDTKVLNKKPKALNKKKAQSGGYSKNDTSSANWKPKNPAKDKAKEGEDEESKAIKASYDEAEKHKKVKEAAAAKEKNTKKKAAATKKKKAKKVWKNEPHSLPKPCGHTSMVHPTNSNRDREWYTEYRWQPGTEYKVQDGEITDQPKPALRGIKASPINGDPCVQIK